MLTISATEVRKDWSRVLDSVARRRPAFIRRTRDHMVLISTETLSTLLDTIQYTASIIPEDDGSITLSLDSMDIVVNGATLDNTKAQLAQDIMEYAEEYYADYEEYSKAPNRKAHLPYVMKALIAESTKELEGAIVCRNGKD